MRRRGAVCATPTPNPSPQGGGDAPTELRTSDDSTGSRSRSPKPRVTGAELRRLVAERAEKLGFTAFGVTRPDAVPALRDRLPAWLADGHHGTMGWMAERTGQRADPAALWAGTRSIVMLGMSAAPERDPLDLLALKDCAAIAAYAQRRDYHEVVKGKLKELGGFLSAKAGQPAKVFVDTAPVMEKPLAEAAGLGWQGKHSVLVSRADGNWLLLGAIFTATELPVDAPATESCGSCRRCLDICPTDAFPAPYRLDARRCIAYLTIEHEGPIAPEFRAAIGNRVFGCDDCLAICPWNKFAGRTAEARMAARADLDAPPLAELARLDDAGFRRRFSGTPIKRTGRDRFLRNVMIAIGNSGEPALAEEAVRSLKDSSPLVRGMAVWACGRLLDETRTRALFEAHTVAESDEAVREEWHRIVPPRSAGEGGPRVSEGWERGKPCPENAVPAPLPPAPRAPSPAEGGGFLRTRTASNGQQPA